MALPITARSPKSWLINFRYGVSPQPAQAPENSNRGCNNCEPLTVSIFAARAVEFRNVQKEIEVCLFVGQMRQLGCHVDCFVLDDFLAFGRADIDAHAAAGAIVGRDLNGHQVIG